MIETSEILDLSDDDDFPERSDDDQQTGRVLGSGGYPLLPGGQGTSGSERSDDDHQQEIDRRPCGLSSGYTLLSSGHPNSGAERSDDDHHQQQQSVGRVHGSTGYPVRQPTPGSSSHLTVQDITEMTLKEDPNANSLLDGDYKDVKVGFEELCPVCGDKVSGYHYGLLTCESCKGFFKRTVQNKKVYSCLDNRSCQIDKSQRKRCPYCRFQKCLSVGMKLEAVRSDRMRGGRNKFGPMYKRDRALKQQAARQAHALQGSCGDIPLLSNGMIPGSPEDVKPDPIMLQASLNLYAGAISTSAVSNAIPKMIPSLNCLSVSAAAPLTSVSVAMSTGGSSPPHPAHPHHMTHINHHPSHQNMVPTSTPQGFGHISVLTVPQPHSPKTHYSQHHHHNNGQHHIQQQHHIGNGSMDHSDTSPNIHHHQTHQVPSHTQALLDFQMSHNRLYNQTRNNNNNNSLGLGESGCPTSSQVHPKVVEALRAFQSPVITGLSERSVLSPLIAEIKATVMDESEVKHKMLTFMQNELSQTDITSSPEQFLPVLCRIVDQLLFLMVEWARNSSFFKEIKVEDQMKLLHNSWSEILILDFIFRQIHNVWGKEIVTPSGDIIGFEFLDKLGLADVKAKVFELIKKGRELKIDFNEYMCLKFLIMLNPDVSTLENRAYIEQSQEKVNAALFEYCLLVYPDMVDKFSQLLMRLSEIRLISIRTEDFLYLKHLSNEVPDQTLLTEMLHAKRRG